MPTPCTVHRSITLMSTRTQRFCANRTSPTLQVRSCGLCARGRRESEGEGASGMCCQCNLVLPLLS